MLRKLTVTTPAFEPGENIPAKYTAEGIDVSPELEWSPAPHPTLSIAVICEDPDAQGGTWAHWVLFNLDRKTTSLKEGMPIDREFANGARHGINDWNHTGYRGPMPPRGHPHRYYFRVYALDCVLNLDAGATRGQVMDAMRGHVLASGAVMGTYQR
jgi:Raf kinase inhibitor-like YbhB/YbcL family protein